MMMMMKSIILGTFLLFVLCGAVSGLGSVVVKGYEYITYLHYNWLEAQQYCRTNYGNGDLATIYTQSDVDDLNLEDYRAWTGLHKPSDKDEFSWVHGDSPYRNWAHDQPQVQEGSDYCAVVHYGCHCFYSELCNRRAYFICSKWHDDHTGDFIPQSKTWEEAVDYCDHMPGYHNMPFFTSSNDIDSAFRPQDFQVWTGLYRHGGTWKWSKGFSEYRNWSPSHPQNNGDCVSISSLGKQMSVQDCSSQCPFICSHDNLVLVKENKTWEEALEHCRALGNHDLISVQPGSDLDFIMRRVMEADTEKVWTGLRFLAGQWLWVNQADMSYSGLPDCPLEWQHCGALSKDDGENIKIRECSERRNFLCYKI
nr:forkhead box protein R1 isoform X1 [Solea senegalensis]